MVGVCAWSFMEFSVRLVHVIKRANAKAILSFPITRLDWEDGFFCVWRFYDNVNPKDVLFTHLMN
jgi:hypothetical protein